MLGSFDEADDLNYQMPGWIIPCQLQ